MSFLSRLDLDRRKIQPGHRCFAEPVHLRGHVCLRSPGACRFAAMLQVMIER